MLVFGAAMLQWVAFSSASSGFVSHLSFTSDWQALDTHSEIF